MKQKAISVWIVAFMTFSVFQVLGSIPAQAAVIKVGSACQKLGVSQKQGNLILKCQRKSNKLVWATTKLSVTKKIPLPVVTIDNFIVSVDSGDLIATVPAVDLNTMIAQFHVTTLVARFMMSDATYIIPMMVTSDNLDADGALNIVQPSADVGTWQVSVAAANSAGQGNWSSSEEFTIEPDLQLPDAPDFTLSVLNGNLTATVAAADVYNSATNFQTTSFIAQFTSPSGAVTSSTYEIQNQNADVLLWVASPSPGSWSVSLAGINTLGQGDWSLPQPYVVSSPTVIAPPQSALNCGTTPQESYQKPGWISSTASQLTTTWISSGVLQASWCPASAISTGDGYGPIIYTVTVDPGGETCTTWTSNTCIISNVPDGSSTTYLMATNEIGTNVNGISTIANSGDIFNCIENATDCYPGPVSDVFQAYGNTFAGLGDCTFAAAADWEQLNLGVTPDAATIGLEFRDAGGSETGGLSAQALFYYWKTHGIAGVVIKGVTKYYTDQIDVQNAVRDYGELLASLTFSPGQNIAGLPMTGGGHMLVVDGFTPQGPLVVTWGLTLQMTWQQWNLEVTGMWGINN